MAQRIHWRTWAEVARCVVHFAETEEGEVETVDADPHVLRLRVPGAVAILHVDPWNRIVHVHQVFPSW